MYLLWNKSEIFQMAYNSLQYMAPYFLCPSFPTSLPSQNLQSCKTKNFIQWPLLLCLYVKVVFHFFQNLNNTVILTLQLQPLLRQNSQGDSPFGLFPDFSFTLSHLMQLKWTPRIYHSFSNSQIFTFGSPPI